MPSERRASVQNMPKSPYKPFTPKAEQLALMPDTSGNTINGLGETRKRRPSPVYWRDPDTLAHGRLQQFFYTQHPDNEEVRAERATRARIFEAPLEPLAATPLEQSSAVWSAQLRSFAETLDMELFGVTALRDDWLFEDSSLDFEWVIMIGVAHDYERMKTAPESAAGAEVIRQYGRGARAAKNITSWLRKRGWEAEVCAGPMAGPLLLIPPAIECGFGELGKHGSIINKDYGSSFRLAAVVTNVPLVATPRETYGVDDFCTRCQVCSNACPPDAILPEKMLVRGELKWYVDFDKCITFFNENYGCGICLAVCPWSIPGRGPRIVEQLKRRAERRAESSSS